MTTQYNYGTPPEGYSTGDTGSRQYDATGTVPGSYGPRMVGEYGPEFINLPPGGRVISTNVTHNQTQNMNLTNSRSVERIVSSYFRNRARGRRIL